MCIDKDKDGRDCLPDEREYDLRRSDCKGPNRLLEKALGTQEFRTLPSGYSLSQE